MSVVVPRTTACRALTDLVAQDVRVKSGVGRRTRYALVGALGFGTEDFRALVEL